MINSFHSKLSAFGQCDLPQKTSYSIARDRNKCNVLVWPVCSLLLAIEWQYHVYYDHRKCSSIPLSKTNISVSTPLRKM